MTDHKILGLLGLCTKAGAIVFGTDACIDLIQRKKIKLIIIAEDAADRTKRNFEFLCKQNEISMFIWGESSQISKAIGKNNKVVVGVKDKNFAQQITKMINGGEIIG